MMMSVEQSVECLAGETDVVHHKPIFSDQGRRGGKPATNRLRYGTALDRVYKSSEGI
jgi:hypothetical protein